MKKIKPKVFAKISLYFKRESQSMIFKYILRRYFLKRKKPWYLPLESKQGSKFIPEKIKNLRKIISVLKHS